MKASDATWAVIDLETTGRPAGAGGEVIEVGIVRWRPGSEPETFERLCRPVLPIPPGIVGVHGITNAMVASARPFVVELPHVLEFLAGAIPVAHNAAFDRSFLEVAMKAEGLRPLEHEFLDTVRLSRHYCPELENHDLESLCRHHRIRRARAHRALDDALATRELLQTLLEISAERGGGSLAEFRFLGAAPIRGAKEPRGLVLDEAQQARLELALMTGDTVEIRSLSAKGNEVRRTIVPYVIDRVHGRSRLVAFDVERGETRTFPVDRILSVSEARVAS